MSNMTENQQTTTNKSEKKNDLISSFNITLKQFINEISETFPEFQKTISKNYGDLEPSSEKYAKQFSKNIEKYHIQISCKNEDMFKEENIFLLEGIDFHIIWNSNISHGTKEAIWKYLHTLLLLGNTINSEFDDISCLMNDLSKAVSDENIDKEKLDNLNEQVKSMLNVIQNLTDENKTKSTENSSSDSGEKSFSGDIFENSKIGKLAQELAKDINVDSLGLNIDEKNPPQNPKDIFDNIIGKNPMKLMGLIQNVGNKIQNKIGSGEINESELINEAQQMMSNLNNNDLFKNAFGGQGGMPDMSSLFSQMNTGNTRVDQNKVRKYSTQERLRRKLEKKRQESLNTAQENTQSNANITNNKKKKKNKKSRNSDNNENQEGEIKVL
tara:strand:+ start:159 stop:1310 length:1152 start_codon:yes stop_codon:yes gene_type:complete